MLWIDRVHLKRRIVIAEEIHGHYFGDRDASRDWFS